MVLNKNEKIGVFVAVVVALSFFWLFGGSFVSSVANVGSNKDSQVNGEFLDESSGSSEVDGGSGESQ